MSLNLSEVFKNFQKIQDNINDLKNETEKLVFLGKSEDGSIEVKMNGRFDPLSVKLNGNIFGITNTEDIEKSILDAMKKAKDLAYESHRQKLKKLTGGIQMPAGLDLPL
tara:strand:+ start:550 stop:876 length:327 start_codon:yes stop_codon:yes gene_type:complete